MERQSMNAQEEECLVKKEEKCMSSGMEEKLKEVLVNADVANADVKLNPVSRKTNTKSGGKWQPLAERMRPCEFDEMAVYSVDGYEM